MARIDIADAFKELEMLLTVETPKACDAARKAAAEVYKRAASQAAPVGKTGKLRKSVKIIEGRPDA